MSTQAAIKAASSNTSREEATATATAALAIVRNGPRRAYLRRTLRAYTPVTNTDL